MISLKLTFVVNQNIFYFYFIKSISGRNALSQQYRYKIATITNITSNILHKNLICHLNCIYYQMTYGVIYEG